MSTRFKMAERWSKLVYSLCIHPRIQEDTMATGNNACVIDGSSPAPQPEKYRYIRGLLALEKTQRQSHFLKSAAEWTSKAVVSLELCDGPIKSVNQASQLEGIGAEVMGKLRSIEKDERYSSEPPPRGRYLSSGPALLLGLLKAAKLASSAVPVDSRQVMEIKSDQAPLPRTGSLCALTFSIPKEHCSVNANRVANAASCSYDPTKGKSKSPIIPEQTMVDFAKDYCIEEWKDPASGFCSALWRVQVLIARRMVKKRTLKKQPAYELLPYGEQVALALRGKLKTPPATPSKKRMVTPRKELADANRFQDALYSNDTMTNGLILLVDTQEWGGDRVGLGRLTNMLGHAGITYKTKRLACGDYQWIWRARNKEWTMPMIVERKRADDLAESLRDGRYHNQIAAMRDWKQQFTHPSAAGCLKYLVEGDPLQYMMRTCGDQCRGVGKCGNANPELLQEVIQELDNSPDFAVLRTENIQATVEILVMITAELKHRISLGEFDNLFASTPGRDTYGENTPGGTVHDPASCLPSPRKRHHAGVGLGEHKSATNTTPSKSTAQSTCPTQPFSPLTPSPHKRSKPSQTKEGPSEEFSTSRRKKSRKTPADSTKKKLWENDNPDKIVYTAGKNLLNTKEYQCAEKGANRECESNNIKGNLPKGLNIHPGCSSAEGSAKVSSGSFSFAMDSFGGDSLQASFDTVATLSKNCLNSFPPISTLGKNCLNTCSYKFSISGASSEIGSADTLLLDNSDDDLRVCHNSPHSRAELLPPDVDSSDDDLSPCKITSKDPEVISSDSEPEEKQFVDLCQSGTSSSDDDLPVFRVEQTFSKSSGPRLLFEKNNAVVLPDFSSDFELFSQKEEVPKSSKLCENLRGFAGGKVSTILDNQQEMSEELAFPDLDSSDDEDYGIKPVFPFCDGASKLDLQGDPDSGTGEEDVTLTTTWMCKKTERSRSNSLDGCSVLECEEKSNRKSAKKRKTKSAKCQNSVQSTCSAKIYLMKKCPKSRSNRCSSAEVQPSAGAEQKTFGHSSQSEVQKSTLLCGSSKKEGVTCNMAGASKDPSGVGSRSPLIAPLGEENYEQIDTASGAPSVVKNKIAQVKMVLPQVSEKIIKRALQRFDGDVESVILALVERGNNVNSSSEFEVTDIM